MKKVRLNDDSTKMILTMKGISKADFSKIHGWIKSLNGGEKRYISSVKEWEILFTKQNVEKLREFAFDIPYEIFQVLDNSEIDTAWEELDIPEKFSWLFEYQQDCLRFSIYHDHRILLSLDVGMGKTATSLAIADMVLDNVGAPIILIVPSLLKTQWKKEHSKFLNNDDRIKIIETSRDLKYYDDVDILIVNFELIARNMIKIDNKGNCVPDPKMVEFKRNNPSLIVIDEVQKVKNLEAKTTKGVEYLCANVPHIIGLTGTPIQSSSKDLYSIVNILDNELFPNYYSFLNRYAYSKVNYRARGVKTWYGAKNSAELHSILMNNVMFRLSKADVGRVTDKPIQTVIPVDLKDYTEYTKLQKVLNEKEEGESGLGTFNKMREQAWEQKKENVFAFIDDLLIESDDKIIVFAINKNVMTDCMERYGDIAVKIDGSVSTKEGVRDRIVERFQNVKKVRLFFGSIYAAGTGLNGLQDVSSTVLFLQWPWVPSEVWQCIGRADRTGQTKTVNVFHLPGRDTIEEIFMRILDNKSQMFNEIVDGKDFEEEDMLDLMLKEAKK